MSGVPNGVSLENKAPLSPTDIPHGALAERAHPASAASSDIGSPRPHVGFEGAEKKLEINFIRTADLRKFSAADIEGILSAAKCSIISVIRNEHVDAYLLAESSLFVYSNKFLLKTCGSTSPLDCIPKLLQVAKGLGTHPDFVQYSRTQFAYPDRQPAIHRSFEKEVEYLNSFFPHGVGHIFGPINGPRWHLYTCDMNPVTVEKEQTLELVMTELDRSKLKQFFRHPDPKYRKHFENVKLPTTAEECTKLAGIDQLFPGSEIDAFLFEPCGYSCNGILNDSYFTIHITPEFHCSYISFETNVIVGNYSEIIHRVLDTFKPGRFTISLFVDEKSIVKSSIRAMPDEYKGYVSKNIAFQQFDGPFNVTCAQVIALASQTATEEEKKLLVAATEELKAASESGTPPSAPLPEPINAIDFTAAAPAVPGQSKDPTSYSNTRKLSVPELMKLVQDAVQKKYPVQSITMDEAAHPEKLIQTVVARDAPNEAFYLVDLGNLVNRFSRWAQAFPHLRPNYAVKCNGHPGVLLALNALGCAFVCSTVFEIKLLLTLGVAPKRITYANAWKPDSHIRYCAKMNVANLICSDVNELRKISKNFPSAQLILHISGDYRPKHLSPAVKYIVDHNTVSGAPLERVPELLQEAKKLQMRVLGISFDIGETCYEVHQFKRALKDAKECFGLAKKILGYELRSLDIGAGFPDLIDDNVLPQPIAPSSQPSAISTAQDPAHSGAAPSQTQNGSPNASPAPGASPKTGDLDSNSLSHSVSDMSKLSAATDAFAAVSLNDNDSASSAANLPSFDSLVARLNHLIPKYFSSKVNFLARPARFLVTSSHLLAVCVIARRTVSSGTVSAPAVSNHPGAQNLPEILPAGADLDSLPPDGFLYYVNDGLYGSFNCMLYDSKKIEPLLVLPPKDPQKFHCTIFGPTCDGVDCIAERDFLPRLEVGDWLYFRNMGAYSASSASSFNGFKPPSVRFISAPPAWLK